MSLEHNLLEGLVPAPLAGQEHDTDTGEEEADEEQEEGPVSEQGHHIVTMPPGLANTEVSLLDIDPHYWHWTRTPRQLQVGIFGLLPPNNITA